MPIATATGSRSRPTSASRARSRSTPTEFSDLSLGYAVHVYKAQGITAEASGILIGGWQTDSEQAYVALSRAREETQIYVSREDLGEAGMDVGAIERLGERMRRSGAQEASIAREIDEKAWSVRRGSSARSSESRNSTAASGSSSGAGAARSPACRPERGSAAGG